MKGWQTGADNHQRCANGFTLVELLAVITIILLLAGFVVGASSYASRKADVARCFQRMETIKNALNEYYVDHNSYPPGIPDNLVVLYNELLAHPQYPRDKPYLIDTNFVGVEKGTTCLIDPWGKAFRYQAPGQYNRGSYDLWSYGPNQQDNSGAKQSASDDINNWSSGR